MSLYAVRIFRDFVQQQYHEFKQLIKSAAPRLDFNLYSNKRTSTSNQNATSITQQNYSRGLAIYSGVPPQFIETPEVDIIYFNIRADSDFRSLRAGSNGPIEDVLVGLARNIEKGCFERVLSVSASKHSLVVVVSTKLSHDELKEKGFMTGVDRKSVV